jgi:hypothetical protein
LDQEFDTPSQKIFPTFPRRHLLKKHLFLSMTLAVLAFPVMAQVHDEPCDPAQEECAQDKPRPDIYPFKPLKTSEIEERVGRLTESKSFLWNINEMTRRGLQRAKTASQPWGGSYWPLNQGQIANPYHGRDYDVFIFNAGQHLSWERNYKLFEKRKEKVHPRIYSLDEKELAELAPSEKYDLLLGDTSFDLTNRVWQYAYKWGSEKKWAFLSSINLPAGYRIPDANSFMALWEGICHGWAVAAGHSPRPERTVWVTLPNGKNMPFYPNDIKALISLMWANSTIQDNVIVEGLRCNKKMPKKDEYGRYIDVEIDKNDDTLLPRCADVHPAVYHTSVVNILGIEGRSFVVDKSAKASIANQPVAGYEYDYFNPDSGKIGSLASSMVPVSRYKDDPFKDARNPEAKYIVGVAMTLKYVDWEFPKQADTNYPSDDKVSKMEFNYDLEIDGAGRIIGGQWRVKRNGNRRIFANNTHQPDFFWVVPKNWKSYFSKVKGLPEWDFNRSSTPPKEFKAAAFNAHSFVYQMTREFGFDMKCPVQPIKRGEGPALEVACEFKYPRPQPLINVVDKLLELSRQ